MKKKDNSAGLHICLLVVELHISHAFSLKDKRRIVKSIKDRIGGKFNVSVAEIDGLDEWQRAVIGIVTLSNDRRHAQQSIGAVENFFQEIRDITVADMYQEWL